MRILVVALVLAASACGSAHVQLMPPPARDASLEVRRAYYRENRPIAVRLLGAEPGAPVFMVLENNTRVDHPSVLVAIVGTDSATARATQRGDDAAAVAKTIRIAGGIGLTLGFGTLLSASTLSSETTPAMDPTQALLIGLVGSGALLAGGAATAVAAMRWDMDAARERGQAFVSFDRSLRERLALTNDPVALKYPAPALVTGPTEIQLSSPLVVRP